MLTAPDLSLVYIMILFGVCYWILKKLYFGPVLALLDERKREVEEAAEAHARALAESKSAVDAAEARLGTLRRQAIESREALRNDGRRQREARLAEARAEAEGLVNQGRAEIEKQIPALRDLLAREAEQISDEVAGKILGGVNRG